MINGKKDKKYSILTRLFSFICTFLLIGSLIFITFAGVGLASGLLLATSVAGIVGPSIVANDGVTETLIGVFEIMLEGLQTIFEIIIDVVSSIFG